MWSSRPPVAFVLVFFFPAVIGAFGSSVRDFCRCFPVFAFYSSLLFPWIHLLLGGYAFSAPFSPCVSHVLSSSLPPPLFYCPEAPSRRALCLITSVLFQCFPAVVCRCIEAYTALTFAWLLTRVLWMRASLSERCASSLPIFSDPPFSFCLFFPVLWLLPRRIPPTSPEPSNQPRWGLLLFCLSSRVTL